MTIATCDYMINTSFILIHRRYGWMQELDVKLFASVSLKASSRLDIIQCYLFQLLALRKTGIPVYNALYKVVPSVLYVAMTVLYTSIKEKENFLFFFSSSSFSIICSIYILFLNHLEYL